MTKPRIDLGAALVIAILLMSSVRSAAGQGGIPTGEPEYSGVFACLGCHSAGEQTPYVDSLPLVRLDEVRVWHQQDQHSLAYCVLSGELGRQMSARLGYNATAAKECLACHAPRHEQRSADSNAPPNYKLSEGVSCEDCHGGSRGWHRLHVLKDQWRELSPEQKQSHGMNDLRDPLTRATICLDCHVGHAAAGQIVTHAMYAAGHPPLASIDIVAYANDLPRHWRTREEQSARGAPAADFGPAADARMATVGHLVAAERSLQLAAQEFETLPDFAHFDCDACHHELSSPSWRQARLTQGAPGRPRFREWPLRMAALTAPVTAETGSDAEVTRRLSELHAALQSQPFGGDGQASSAAATELAKIWRVEARVLAKQTWEDGHSQQLAGTILADALDSERPPDYDTARTLTWLLRHALPEERRGDDADPAWTELVNQLGLSISPRRGAATKPGLEPACDTPPKEPIAAALSQSLRPRADYDPAKFQAALRKYAEGARVDLSLPNANALHK